MNYSSRFRRHAVLFACAIALTGCGKSGSPEAGPAPAASPAKTAKSGGRNGDGLPPPDCPAKVSSKVDGPDINGLKLGLTHDEALNLARCALEGGFVASEPRYFSPLNTGTLKLGPQIFTVQAGETTDCKFTSFSDAQKCGHGNRVWTRIDETMTVATPGVPGRETAVGIWRTQHFAAGAQPAAETVREALIAKYGPPQRTQQYDGNRPYVQLWWLKDPAGQLITERNPLNGQCPTINAHGDQSQSWSPSCGLTIAAQLTLAVENPLLVGELSVGMADQAKLYAYGTAMQEEILALEAQRKEGELKSAKDAVAVPKL